MMIVLLIITLAVSLLFGFIATVVQAWFFLWPVITTLFVLPAAIGLIRLILIHTLFKPAHKMAARKYNSLKNK